MTPTGPVESWTQSTETLGAIYPFPGFEAVMVGACLAFWLGWTIWQVRTENAEYKQRVETLRETSDLE